MAGGIVTVAQVLRAGRADAKALLDGLAHIWVSGAHVDRARLFEGSDAQRVALPAYAFQRERYWLGASGESSGGASIGVRSAEHPLLGAVVALADGRGWLFTGRISLQSHPWLAQHVVAGHALLPGAAFVEMALRAGGQVGCATVQELVQEVPLVMPAEGGVRLQTDCR